MEEEINKFFTKRDGTTDKGKDYEHGYLANLTLKLVTDDKVEDFYISSNTTGFGAFDDVIAEVKYKDKDEWQTYAIQLKHKENKAVRNKDLESTRERDKDFSISWYFKDYCDNLKKTEKKLKIILYTNSKAQLQNSVQLCLDEEQINATIVQIQKESSPPEKDLLSSSEKGVCYVLRTENKHEDFFEKFFIYANQAHVDNMKKLTMKLFCNIFSTDKTAFDKYLNFFTVWSMQKGLKEKLNKTWMKQTIAICVLSAVIKPLSFSSNSSVGDNGITFREAVSKYHITTLQEDSYEKIKSLWCNAIDDLDYERLNQVKKKYQIEKNYINSRDDLEEEDEEISTLLWIMKKCPLVVKEQPQIYEVIKLCPDESFIILNSNEKNLRYVFANPVQEENYNYIFRNLQDLKKEEHIFERILSTYSYSLEGQDENILKTLIDLDDSLTSIVTTDKLVQMMDGPLLIGKVKEVLPPCHVSRTLSKILIDSQFLKKCEDAVIVIDRVESIYTIKETFNTFNIVDVEEDVSREERRDNTIYVSKNNYALKDFEKLFSEHVETKNCHQFRYLNKDTLEWVRSSSSVEELDKFRMDDEYSDKIISELELFRNGDNDINIICANPGMGKSTLMRSLKLSNSSTWTVFIYSRSHGSYFRKKEKDFDSFMKYIFDDICDEYDDFEKRIFQELIKHGHIQLIWDGLDEVSDENLQTVLDLVKLVSKTGVRQWITSRNHTKDTLESVLNTFSRKVQQFSEDEQRTYVKTRLQLEDDKVSEIFTRIKTNLEAFSNNDVLGIPLQIYMLTELLSQNLEGYLKLLDHTFTILDLYQHFVKEKFEIYYREKTKSDLTIDAVYEKCELEMDQRINNYKKISRDLYLDNRFSMLLCCRILCTRDKFLDSIKTAGDDVGIISLVSKENVPKFSHDTYGEYFAALYLFEKDPHRAQDDAFVSSKKFINIRFFLDLMLSKTSKAHVAVLYKNFLLLEECVDEDFDNQDALGRDVLELACIWSQKYKILKVKEDENGKLEFKKKYINSSRNRIEKLSYSQVNKSFEQIRASLDIYVKRLLFLLPFLIQSFGKTANMFDAHVIANVFFYAIKFDYVAIFTFMENASALQAVYEVLQPKELLNAAISFRSLKCLQKLLSQKNYLNVLENNVGILLHTCRFAFADVFSILLRSEIFGINKILYLACERGNRENVEFLLKIGARLSVPDSSLDFALLRWRTGSQNVYPMHYACLNEENGLDIVKLLFERGEEIDVADDAYYRMPIHFASGQRNGFSIVDYLLSQGAKIDSLDISKKKPIHYACDNGSLETVKLLIEKGETLDQSLKNQRKLLHYGCRNREHGSDIVKYLMVEGQDLEVCDFKNITPLHRGCKKGSFETLKLMVENGGKIDVVDLKGRLPIHNACRNENFGLDMVRLLVHKGAKVNVQDVEGRTPLHEACRNWNFGAEIAKFLISKNAKLDIVDATGRTPLHVACRNWKSGLGCVKLLLEKGANKECRDSSGRTILDCARESGNLDVLNFLNT